MNKEKSFRRTILFLRIRRYFEAAKNKRFKNSLDKLLHNNMISVFIAQ